MRDSDSAGHDRRQARTERGSRDQKLLLRRDAELLGFLLQLTAEQKVSLAAAVVFLIRLVLIAPAAAGMATQTATAIETESRSRATAAVAIAIAIEAVGAMVTANAMATRPRRCCRDSAGWEAAWGVQEQRSCAPDPGALVKEEATSLEAQRAETVALAGVGAFALVSAAVFVAADRQKWGQQRQWCWCWRRYQGWWYLYLGRRQRQRPP